jgi:sec-independent protein translocase protein TatA
MNPHFLLGVIGPTEVILIVIVVMLMFGGKKIPELMKGLGQGMREFKEGMNGEQAKEKDKPKDTNMDKNKNQDS